MNLTESAISNNRVTFTCLVVVAVLGFQAYKTLPRQEDPGFLIRVARVTTRFPGANPARVEKLVTDPLEKAIQEIPELDFVASSSKTGISVITVTLQERYKNLQPIWDTLRRKVEREARNLPEGVRQPEVNDEFGDVFGMVISLTGNGFSYRQLKDIADDMHDELLQLDDVAKVQILGTQKERIFVEYNSVRLAQAGLTVGQLSQLLRSQNIVDSGGKVRVGSERITIEPSGNLESIDELAMTVVKLPKTGQVVHLSDLVRIRRGYIDPPEQKAHTSAGAQVFRDKSRRFPFKKPRTAALVMAISMREGGLLTELGQEVERKLETFKARHPIGIQLEKAFFQPHDVQKVIDDFVESLLQAVGIVMAAMLLFLGLRTGLVVAVLIPMAIAVTLAVMDLFGIGLNQISLAALIIALGMLVDNGVVMAESSLVLMNEGMDGKAAAIQSAKELRIPLLIASLTTAAAFLPIALAKSAVGEYCIALFQVVTIALLASWVLSLTMTPLLCAVALKPNKRNKASEGDAATSESFDSAFYRAYRRILLLMVRRPALTVVLMFCALFGTMTLFKYVPKIFFPASDRPTFEIEVQLVPGTAIEKTTKVVQKIEGYLHEKLRSRGVKSWAAFIGQGGPRYYLGANPEPPNSGYAQILVQHSERKAMERDMEALSAWARDTLPGAKVDLSPRSMGPPVKYPVQIRLSGPNMQQLFDYVDEAKARMRKESGIASVVDDWGLRAKRLTVNIDQARARRAGVTSQDVATSMRAYFSGLRVTDFREDEHVIPVLMRAEEAERDNLGKLETLQVTSQASGVSVPLKQIAESRLEWQPSEILRRDRQLTVTLNARLKPGYIANDVLPSLLPWFEKKAWRPGYGYEPGGEVETSGKANASINAQLPLAFFVIVLLLVAQFNSLRRPLIILLTLPLGLIGVVLGLLAAKSTFGFMTFLGVISLFGIVINNAIVLIDRIEIERNEHGLSATDAIVMAAQRRFRPIMLTTATTIAGLIPLWLAGSPMFQPMAVAIIFGLAFATVLTLGAVPALYAIFFRVRFRGYRYG